MYQALLGEMRHRTGKSISQITMDELLSDAWTLRDIPKIDELSCAEMQHKKKMLNHQEKWRSKKNRRFSGYHSGKR